MSEQIQSKILSYLKSEQAKPLHPQRLAKVLSVQEADYHAFRDALRELMRQGRVTLGTLGAVVLPTQQQRHDIIIGTYRHNKRGFGFVVPTDPQSHEDLYIPQGQSGGAITGDIVSSQITSRGQRDGKTIYEGKIVEVIQRTHKQFVGELLKRHGLWLVMPEGNALTEPILTPDAASRHLKPGAKVVVELTQYPANGQWAQGVITQVLGKQGEKDVDLKTVIVQHNLPGPFPEEVLAQARKALDKFHATHEWPDRYDLTDEIIVTVDPDDAKDYDDAISLRHKDNGLWELGVHIADVAFFVPLGTPLDDEASQRGNSCYFPGHVIPMLPEVLSNGVCSLQEAVPRLCKSVFITINKDARPAGVRFANTLIKSRKRLRYQEAQAIIDRDKQIPHPDGPKTVGEYDPEIVQLLDDMNVLAKRIQKRRLADGQIVLELPEVELVLDEEGKVAGTKPEDESFTHTLIEMFMVEANEAVARLLESVDVPFLRRIHPKPEVDSSERLRHFIEAAGYRLPKTLDYKAIQALLSSVKGKPESHTVNLAVLKSLSRAEYSPEPIGHYALASEHYCHFTSPIRRYADLLVHRLLDSYIRQRDAAGVHAKRKKKAALDSVVSYDDLVKIGRHISFTERRADDAERELRQIKVLELLQNRIGDEFMGVVTGITNFGIFIQIQEYLIDGLIRYEQLMDDWWAVDERSGKVRGERTGRTIGIGDVVKSIVVSVDLPRRELNLAISEFLSREGAGDQKPEKKDKRKDHREPRRRPKALRSAAHSAARGGKRHRQ
jgi:ribonuclease R